MKAPTLENLPNVVAELKKGQSEILALLLNKVETLTEPDNPLNIDEVAILTGYTKPTIYGYCQKNTIPHNKKNGRLFFFKTDIINWIKQGKAKTLKEMEAEADVYLSNKNKGLK